MAVMLLSAASAAYGVAALAPDTVAYYSFDNSGNIGQDFSTNGNNLVTASGTPAYSSGGQFGGALSLNGSTRLGINAALSAYPTGLNNTQTSPATPFSISVWIKPASSAISGYISWG